MRYLCSLFVVVCAFGQPAVPYMKIIPQENRIGALTEYVVSVCNQSPTESLTGLQGMKVWGLAKVMGINFATNANVLKAAKAEDTSSGWHIFADIATYAGLAFTIGDQAGAFKIGDEDKAPARWKATIPVAGFVILKVNDYAKNNKPPSITPDLSRTIPSEFSLPPNGCRDFTMYGAGILTEAQ